MWLYYRLYVRGLWPQEANHSTNNWPAYYYGHHDGNGLVERAVAILGVPEGSDDVALKRAFRLKALQVHPDKVAPCNKAWATEEMQALNWAWKFLTCFPQCRSCHRRCRHRDARRYSGHLQWRLAGPACSPLISATRRITGWEKLLKGASSPQIPKSRMSMVFMAIGHCPSF